MSLALPPSSTFILTFCLNFIEVGPTIKADRIVRMDRTSIMEALKRKKSRASLDVASSPKRLRLSEAPTKEGNEVRGLVDKGRP